MFRKFAIGFVPLVAVAGAALFLSAGTSSAVALSDVQVVSDVDASDAPTDLVAQRGGRGGSGGFGRTNGGSRVYGNGNRVYGPRVYGPRVYGPRVYPPRVFPRSGGDMVERVEEVRS
jgi:hypothetical protein